MCLWASLNPLRMWNICMHTLPASFVADQGGGVGGGISVALGSNTQTQNSMYTNCVSTNLWPLTHPHTHTHTYSLKTDRGVVGCCVVLRYSLHNNPGEGEAQTTHRLKVEARGEIQCIYTSTHTLGCPHVSSMCRRHACWCACVITPAAIYVRGQGVVHGKVRPRDSRVCRGVEEEVGLPGSVLGLSSEQGME